MSHTTPSQPCALLSVSDKRGIADLAGALHQAGYQLLSTGGTASVLRDAGLPVTGVSELTGFPEIMDGRVKTLHPRIHGGLLGRRDRDREVMTEHGIPDIDVLVLNLYPFEATVADPDCSLEDAVEQIDIGGPAMLRAAAKNFRDVAVVTDPDQYPDIIGKLGQGGIDAASRFRLSVAAFNHVARYDDAISDYLSSFTEGDGDDKPGQRVEFPAQANGCFIKMADLRYGENPHQQAAWYRDLYPARGSLAQCRQLQGKELSYNNIADTDAAWDCVRRFSEPACVIVKHANPCGVAVGPDCNDAYEKAWATDSTSAFGGIIAFNRELDASTAANILGRQFLEVLVAPDYSDAALEVLAAKPNIRVLRLPLGDGSNRHDIKRISSGILVQTADNHVLQQADCRVVSVKQPDEQQWQDLLFAWNVVRAVKSNAIVYAAAGRTLGIGAGQMSRVDSARIARWKAGDAGLELARSAMASDAFFPFRDGIDTAAEAGVSAVIQPGGSMRDEEVIAAADEHGLCMVFTGIRHFRH